MLFEDYIILAKILFQISYLCLLEISQFVSYDDFGMVCNNLKFLEFTQKGYSLEKNNDNNKNTKFQ